MKRGIALLTIIVLILLSLYSFSTGITGFSTATTEVPVDGEVTNEINEHGKASVIVVLKEEEKKFPKTTGFLTAVIKTKAPKQKVLATLSNEEFKKKHDYSVIEGFSGEITAEGLKKLKQNPNVEKIYFDKVYTLSLTESVPLINASKLYPYQVNNQNLTGAGETICILDTGIDTDHPAFEDKILAEHCYCTNDSGGCCSGNTIEDNSAEDDHGHGTHVTGIAAANGSVVGVAPGANIVMIKVCDSIGSCSSSDLLSGIEWCVANKDSLNISIMSLSLGDGKQYTSTTCPSNPIDDGMASAYSTGIFIVAASGNNIYTSGISHPACNENVTSAGATDKSDVITYNRGGDLLTILAPGVSITSTYYNGGTATMSGTSMSTPHIAGAAAILQQYARASSGLLSQAEIEAALNNTGKVIYDAASGGTYSRISVYEAVKFLTQNPTLMIYSPINSTYDNNISLPLEYEAVDIDGLDAVWYNIDEGENIFLSGNTTFNTTSGSKIFNLYANDTWGNEDSTQVFFTISLIPRIGITSPENMTYATGTDLEFNFSAIDQDLDTCWYKIDDGIDVIIDSCANTTLNINEGAHNLKLFVNDSENNEVMEEISFSVDLTNPAVHLESPSDNSFSKSNIQFKFKTVDPNVDSCSLYGSWDGWHLNQTKTEITNDTLTSFDEIILEDGNYTWNVECTDSVGNKAFNDTNYTITVDSTQPTLTVSSPENTTYFSASLDLKFSAIDANLDSCWYSLNDGINTTITNYENTTLSISNEQNNIKVYTKDMADNEVSEETSFLSDLSYPLITLSLPSEGASIQSPASFNYTVEDIGITNCSLLINGTINLTDESIVASIVQEFNIELTKDQYTWSISCTDNGNRENVSEERTITICTESWNCTEWSSCSDSQQTRTCTDLNSCGTTHSKPTESQSCSTSSDTSGGETGSEGAAGSTPIPSDEDGGETQPEKTPAISSLPEEKKEEQEEKPAEEINVTEVMEITEEQGFISKIWNKLKGVKEWVTNPKQTATSISTRAVDGVKNHKIAASGFVFIIGMMVFAHFYFFRRRNISLTQKVKEKMDIPRPNITVPPKVKEIKAKFKGIHNDIKEKMPELTSVTQPIKNVHKSIFSRFDLFKSYRDLLKPPKKPSE